MPKKQKKKKPSTKKSSHYESGTPVKRKNKFCPKCGSGVFMAQHQNRTTCGRCHYTEFS